MDDLFTEKKFKRHLYFISISTSILDHILK